MNPTANITIDLLVLILNSVGILTSFSILFFIFRSRQQSPLTVKTFLSCNTYVATFICCLILIEMYAHNLYGHTNINVSFDNWWCHIRGYLVSVALVSIYCSYLIQACFRLFRVVFFRYKQLQTFRFIITLIFLQWTLNFLSILPALFLHDFEYLTPDYYYCQVSYTNVGGLMYISVVVYYFPMGLIGLIYFYIIYYMKKMKNSTVQQQRQQSNQRDLIVLRRILILIGMLMMVSFPAVLIYLWYVFTGYLYSMIYQFQWLTFSIGLSILPTITVIVTPHLRELLSIQFRRNHRVHTVTVVPRLDNTQTNV